MLMTKITLPAIVLTFCLTLNAQTGPSVQKSTTGDKAATAVVTSPEDLAKATLAAHGGDKLKQMRSIVMKGSVDASAFGQTMPGAFSTAISGDRYYFEINTVAQQLKQVFDGRKTYCSFPDFALPPMTTFGFPLLRRIGDAGYSITALNGKKKMGFRITSPEGFFTDFFIDEKTKQLKGFEAAYEVGSRSVTTSVEIDEYQVIDGVSAPKKYSQRIDLGQMTIYASFKAKSILINSEIADDAFALPK